MNNLKLNSVTSVHHTPEDDVYILYCNITDLYGDTIDSEYCSRPDDNFGLNPTIRQWLLDNPEFPIQPYVPPTEEEIRAKLPVLTSRQFRLGLLAASIQPSQIDFAISQMPDGPQKDAAQIEWEYATSFTRTHPLISTISAALGLTPEVVDTLWTNAYNL